MMCFDMDTPSEQEASYPKPGDNFSDADGDCDGTLDDADDG